MGPVTTWLYPEWEQAGTDTIQSDSLLRSPTEALRVQTRSRNASANAKRVVENWKRKDYYDTMEITVSNFKLGRSQEGSRRELVGRGIGKTALSLLMFGKRGGVGGTFPGSVIKLQCWYWFTAWISKLWAPHVLGDKVADVKTCVYSVFLRIIFFLLFPNTEHSDRQAVVPKDILTIAFLTESWSLRNVQSCRKNFHHKEKGSFLLFYKNYSNFEVFALLCHCV